jgi:hypothetical protein
MHDPREPHLAALKWIMRYIRGMMPMGLFVCPCSQSDLVICSDADWVGCPNTCRSTEGMAAFLGENLVPWSSQRLNTVSRSSTEANYRAVANAIVKVGWLD